MSKTFLEGKKDFPGLDILRLLAMAMVLLLHISGFQFGARLQEQSLTFPIVLNMMLYHICLPCVAILGMLTGYFLYASRPKINRILELLLQCWIYAIGITLIYQSLGYPVDSFDLQHSILPITGKYWWYMTAYFGILPFTPFLNHALRYASIRECINWMIGLLIVTIFIPWIVHRRYVFGLDDGLSGVWLIVCYITGALFRKIQESEEYIIPTMKQCVFFYIGLVIVSFILRIIKVAFHITGKWYLWIEGLYDNNLSFYVFITAIILLMIFSRIKLLSGGRSIIRKLAVLSLAIYLLHMHPLCFNTFCKYKINLSRITIIEYLEKILFEFITIGGISLMVDFIRQYIFDVFKIKVLLMNIAVRFEKFVNKVNT